MHSIVTTFREAVIKVEVANFGAAIDTLIDQDEPELEQVFLSFPMGVEFQHFKTCYYTPLQTYL